MASTTEFGKTIEKKLIDLERPQNWLIEQVRAQTGLYFDSSYLYKIKTGKLATPKIVWAIREILGLEEVKMQNRAESAPRYSLGDLRDLLTRVNCGADLVLAVQEAMTLSGSNAVDYGGALYGAYWYLTDACERLETAIDTMMQKEGGEHDG